MKACFYCKRDLPEVPLMKAFVVAHVCSGDPYWDGSGTLIQTSDPAMALRAPTTTKSGARGRLLHLYPQMVWDNDSIWEPIISHPEPEKPTQTNEKLVMTCMVCQGRFDLENMVIYPECDKCKWCAKHTLV